MKYRLHKQPQTLPALTDREKADIEKLADIEKACQVIVHHGTKYQVVSISGPDEMGNRTAKLILWRPF